MKNLVKEKAFKNFISSILIMVLLIGGYYFPIGKAEEVSGEQNITLTATPIPSNVKIVENTVEKEKLLGTTFEKAKVNYPLGIASEFSIFAKENVNFTGADVEGRVAAGGSVTATTDYEFQIGWKNTNDELADVIVGNGPIENVALTFGADDEGNVIDDDKKVAVSTNATNMNYSDFSDEELTKIVASDLIDFENAFEYYKQLSLAFTNMGNLMSNEVSKTEGEIVGNFTQLSDPNPTGYSRFYGEDLRDISDTHGELYTVGDAIVLSGTNSKLNVFSIDADEIRNYRKKGIVLDVPNNSDVILNIEGDIIEYAAYSGCRGIYYPLAEEEIANIDITNEDIVYVRKNNDTQLLKSGDETYKIFKRLNNGTVRKNTADTDSNKVLINATDATKIATSAFPCSILAPNAHVSLTGYMPGNLICNSYSGTAQFGTSYYNGATTLENSFKIDVKKIDSETKNEINGAQLEILDLQGNSLYKWTSGEDINITLNEGDYILKEISAGDSYENVVNKESTFTVKGITYVDDDNNNYSYDKAKITLGTQVKETTLVEHTEDWVSNYYESNIVSDNEDISTISLSNTVELNNNEKVILENTSDNSFKISKYDSTGNLILEKDVTGPSDINNIVNTEVTDNMYTWFAESNTGLYYTFTYNVSEDSFNINTITPITINNIEDILGSSNYKSKATSDGGIIAYNMINKNGTYKIDGKNTESGKNIIYTPCSDVNTNNIFITVKFNSNGKVQWANFFETDINLVSFSPEKLLETEDGFVMAGGLGGDLLYIDSKENTSRKDFIRNKDDLFSTSNSLGRLKPFLIKIDNTGKICYKDYISEIELNKDFGGIYKNFSAIKISNGDIYVVVSSSQLANTGKMISYTKCKFPITWEALYSGVSNAKNIRKVSFEVNTNNATTLTDKDLYVIVAENNGEPFKWIEFLNWTKTQNGDRIETDVPIVKEFYPYYTKMDHYINHTYNEMEHIKFEPHFYRQNLEDPNDTAEEVYDIDINNIKVHWYTTEDEVTTYTAQNYVYTVTTPSEIILENNHITTNVTINKTDKETNATLPLATYGLYNSNGELIETKTTNSDGTLTFDNNKLNVGDYYIQEIEAPEGYKLSTEKITFTVTKTEDFTFNLKNEKNKSESTDENEKKHASIKVIKLQKGSETRLENVEFGLYNKNELCGLPADTLLSVAKTNIYGEAVFSIDIPVGEYYVKEIKTIDGYILSDEKQEINFTESKDFELIFENDYTKVKIKKVNEQNELIENAKLQLQDMDGNIIEEWTTTTENGYRIDAKLVAGHKYKLVEIEAPQGYNKAEDIEFTVNTDGKLNVVKMVDTEKLSEKIPQTGNKTNIPFIIIICIVAYFGIVNAGKLVYISIKKKGN